MTVNGVHAPAPVLDETGRLWLKEPSSAEGGAERLEARVNRIVSDDVPMTVTTRIELVASGKSQEVLLSHALLAEFVPLSLVSPLPARFETDGRLRVQVRPGRFTIVDHALSRIERGLVGFLIVDGPMDDEIMHQGPAKR